VSQLMSESERKNVSLEKDNSLGQVFVGEIGEVFVGGCDNPKNSTQKEACGHAQNSRTRKNEVVDLQTKSETKKEEKGAEEQRKDSRQLVQDQKRVSCTNPELEGVCESKKGHDFHNTQQISHARTQFFAEKSESAVFLQEKKEADFSTEEKRKILL
jgi:hypothetical protein